MNPDRISEFQRGQRQQEAFYDGASAMGSELPERNGAERLTPCSRCSVQGWEQSLAGKGLKRGAEDESTGERKRPSAKQIEKFKQAKEVRLPECLAYVPTLVTHALSTCRRRSDAKWLPGWQIDILYIPLVATPCDTTPFTKPPIRPPMPTTQRLRSVVP